MSELNHPIAQRVLWAIRELPRLQGEPDCRLDLHQVAAMTGVPVDTCATVARMAKDAGMIEAVTVAGSRGPVTRYKIKTKGTA